MAWHLYATLLQTQAVMIKEIEKICWLTALFLPNQFFLWPIFFILIYVFKINTRFFPFVIITLNYFINMDIAQDAGCMSIIKALMLLYCKSCVLSRHYYLWYRLTLENWWVIASYKIINISLSQPVITSSFNDQPCNIANCYFNHG